MPQFILQLTLAVLPYAIAFAAGYGIRELISRRRRAAWLDKNRQRQERAAEIVKGKKN